MSPRGQGAPPRFVEWALRRLARLHPRWFRERYEEEIVTCFREQWRDEAAGRGPFAAIGLFARTALGIVSTSWRQLHSPISLLDLRLGARRLVRYPVVTILSIVSMAFVILGSAVAFEIGTKFLDPDLGFPNGDRVVALQVWDRATGRLEPRLAFDVVRWRRELRTVEAVGAYLTIPSNLIQGDGTATVVDAVMISPSIFGATDVSPTMGRTLRPEDERANSERVAVIGHRLWVSAFRADPDIIGRKLRLGSGDVTVVGVMPAGFGFPVNNDFWMPLMPLEQWGPREGPTLQGVIGLLAPGVSRWEANRELRIQGERLSRELPEQYTRTSRELISFPRKILGNSESKQLFRLSPLVAGSNVPLLLLLLLVLGNVALLVYARAATRESDLVVRAALGASHARIVGELFAETLILSIPAALLGLALVRVGLERTLMVIGEEYYLPYWFTPSLSPATLVYAGALTIFAAYLTAVLPARRLLPKDNAKTFGLSSRLKGSGPSGGGYRFGGVWNAVIVCQIAVAAPLTVLLWAGAVDELKDLRDYDFGFAADEYVGGRLGLNLDPTDLSRLRTGPFDSLRYPQDLERLRERLLEDPRVRGVGFTESLPGEYRPPHRVEVEGLQSTSTGDLRAGVTRVDVDYLNVLGVERVAGRGFTSADLEDGVKVVVVKEEFARRAFGGGNAIGRRLRLVLGPDNKSPWYEIVGVVRNITNGSIYLPMSPPFGQVSVVVHMPLATDQALALLQSTVLDVDPVLRLDDPLRLSDYWSGSQRLMSFFTFLIAFANGLALVLAWGGLYAVMSFTVSQRRREIGVRRALGASRTRVLAAILRRPMLQAGAGMFAGAAILVLMLWGDGSVFSRAHLPYTSAVIGSMLGVCLLAALVPARKALAVVPMDALRAEG